MGRQTSLQEAYIKPPAVFYGFILGYYIGIRWNLSPNGGMGNPKLYKLTQQYLTHTCGEDEWAKRQVLDVIRDRSRNDMRDVTATEFPSLFPKGRQRPLQIPEELKGYEIIFDLDLIHGMKDQVEQIKQELIMNAENATNETATEQASAPKKTTTVVVPEGVELNSLTLDNFQQLTGKRFRMTKEQRARNQAGSLTREQALEEFKKNFVSDNKE